MKHSLPKLVKASGEISLLSLEIKRRFSVHCHGNSNGLSILLGSYVENFLNYCNQFLWVYITTLHCCFLFLKIMDAAHQISKLCSPIHFTGKKELVVVRSHFPMFIFPGTFGWCLYCCISGARWRHVNASGVLIVLFLLLLVLFQLLLVFLAAVFIADVNFNWCKHFLCCVVFHC